MHRILVLSFFLALATKFLWRMRSRKVRRDAAR